MNRTLTILASVAALSGCAMQIGGSGQTTRGAPLVSRLDFASDLVTLTATIQSPEGWACSATLRDGEGTGRGVTKSAPMTCTNGATGNSVWVIQNHPTDITITFALNNGEKGSVRHRLN
jgi:hypothetical protein